MLLVDNIVVDLSFSFCVLSLSYTHTGRLTPTSRLQACSFGVSAVSSRFPFFFSFVFSL